MKKETFSNVKFKIVSSKNDYKEVLCTYTSNKQKFYRFYQLKIKNGAPDSYYINNAKDKFNKSKNGKQATNDSDFYLSPAKVTTNKKAGIFAASLGVAAAVALAVALPLTLNFGGLSADQEKVNKALDSAIVKVDALNKTLANIKTEADTPLLSLNSFDNSSNGLIDASYYKINPKSINNAVVEQQFGLYIFNNIYYCFRHILPDNKLPVGSVITGTTTRMPDPTLQQIWDTLKLPVTTLSAKIELEEDGVAFQADWDCRNDKLKSIPELAMYSMVIETNGKVFYDFNTNKIKRINLNYYWTDPHRIFDSFNYDYENNTFNIVYAFINRDPSHKWEYDTTTKYLTDEWNDGTLTYEKLLTHGYNSYFTATGKISDKVEELNPDGYGRSVSNKTSKEDTYNEGTSEFIAPFKRLYEDSYETNKDVKIRTEDDLLDLTNAHKVNIDDCVRCGEARTKIYWLNKEVEGSYQFDRALVPYLSKDTLVDYLNKMITESSSLSNDQIALLNKAKTYFTNLSEGRYFGEVIADDNAGFTYGYKTDSRDYGRYNVYSAYYFTYLLVDSAKPDVKVNFFVENDKPVIGKAYGKERPSLPVNYDGMQYETSILSPHEIYKWPTIMKLGESTELRFIATIPGANVTVNYLINGAATSESSSFYIHFPVGNNKYDIGIHFYPYGANAGDSIKITSIVVQQ